MLAIHILEATNSVCDLNLLAFAPGEDLGHAERLTQKTLRILRARSTVSLSSGESSSIPESQ